ncbi:NMDA receptor-regulated protein 2 [Camponotus floridanus]|uniref:NMDA receptor-regulated protein 2 n=1 Tax=Camponotus floridanus TaxID=104421 RepID=E2ACR4_CAMFO|nr:NMDA receptor-regulated protein 2 [Camponotus floridanus]
MIDDVFIEDERLERESAMHRIMRDEFRDPFEDIEQDYANVNMELIKKYLAEDPLTDTEEEEEQKTNDKKRNRKRKLKNIDSDCKQTQEKNPYVPGIRKLPFNFPKRSCLTKIQHSMCLRALLKLYNNEQKGLSKEEQLDLESYIGSFSKVTWPKLNRPFILNTNYTMLLNKYQCATNNVTQHFRFPVSDDIYCENFAIKTKADFVISSSGLKCLLNFDSCYLNSWIIPIVVKSHNGKNVVYIDKRIPPNIATIPQQNTWVYKYILRHYFVDANNEVFNEKMQHTKENKSENITIHSDLGNMDLECSAEFNDYLKIYEEELYEPSDEQKSENSDDLTSGNETNNIKTNVMYKLFTIGPTESLNQELGKHDVKEYQMLVRTKTDGTEVLPNKTQHVILTPKMEHQLGLGAEAVTFEELSHQWASLIFRPGTILGRVRIEVDSSEIIQIEKHTTASLSNEMRRLYNTKIEDSLSILHNIIEGLSSLTPGQYIMRHVPQRGPFAYIYKQVEEPGKNVFDLHTVCQSAMLQTVPKTPWPLIDTMLTTPAIRQFKKMPAMFNPSYYQSLSNKLRGRPRKIDSTESG